MFGNLRKLNGRFLLVNNIFLWWNTDFFFNSSNLVKCSEMFRLLEENREKCFTFFSSTSRNTKFIQFGEMFGNVQNDKRKP